MRSNNVNQFSGMNKSIWNVLICGKMHLLHMPISKKTKQNVKCYIFNAKYCIRTLEVFSAIFTDNMLHVHFFKCAYRTKTMHYAYNYVDIADNCSSNHAFYMALPFCCTLYRLSCVCPTQRIHPLFYCSYSVSIPSCWLTIISTSFGCLFDFFVHLPIYRIESSQIIICSYYNLLRMYFKWAMLLGYVFFYFGFLSRQVLC